MWSSFFLFFSWQVELKATTEDPGTTLRAPTSEAGLAPACKDTCFGELTLQIWERRYDGTKGKVCSLSYSRFGFCTLAYCSNTLKLFPYSSHSAIAAGLLAITLKT